MGQSSQSVINNSMQIVPLLSFLDQLKIYHWQTRSYAEHKALGKAYDAISGLTDTLVETYLGKYGKTYVNKEYSFSIESYTEGLDVKKAIITRKLTLMNYLRNDLLSDNDKDLLNIVDSIEVEINHLQYLLDLK